MSNYNHKEIEPKWQARWEKKGIFRAPENPRKNKAQYILDMFPYPSGAGLHVGHPEGYTATDIYCRYLRMKGFDVLHPMGWDSFGLPAENYAIKQGVHPKTSTKNNIDTFRRQIKSLGFSYDWSKEFATSSKEYYRWTQWLFLQLYKAGLAYKAKAPVNWCEGCQTVLANEQVVNGKCERCSGEVVQKDLEQWFFKITQYAEPLLAHLDDLDWPEPIKMMQKNWIGKSEGAMLTFNMSSGKSRDIGVFTTRPDTLYGATYMVLAPENNIVDDMRREIGNWGEVEKYRKRAAQKSALERTDLEKEKTGIELKGVYAVNPATKEKIPVWIADYVLLSYGTGAIMAVPAHDARDYEFAKKYGLKIREVVKTEKPIPSEEPGIMINSEKFNGMDSEEAKWKITEKAKGKRAVQYKIRDWLISRQRYWGSPIPIIYCDKCGEVPVEEKDLPVELPEDVDFRPHGESPLARSKEFQNVKCPKCHGHARRESDTMDTFVDSSWYFLRYCDAHNEKVFAGKEKIKKWMPVDMYVGGAEHAVLHLLYARFFTMALHDRGFLDFQEPFLSLKNQGLILGPDNQKMSKSRGNVINPDDVIDNLGADTMRMYEMFMGPLEDAKPWDTNGIIGVRRFLEKVWDMQNIQNARYKTQESETKINRELNRTIKKSQEDIESFHFNTAVSQFMIFVNTVHKEGGISKEHFETFLKILNPFAPHITNELWERNGHKDLVESQDWPEVDVLVLSEDKINYVVQVNGKMRSKIEADSSDGEKDVAEAALKDSRVSKYIEGRKITKQIFVEGKLINFVVQ